VTPARGARALALAVLAAGCAQQPITYTDELDAKPWEARKLLLPPAPNAADLVPFYVGPTPFAFFVDRSSVVLGQDGVVRYTLVARSGSGATNVSYEGIRCATYARRAYAFGAADGSWSQARNSQWVPMDRLAADPQTVLANDFFCPDRGPVRSTDEARRALALGNRR
jgi:hypothetical protein